MPSRPLVYIGYIDVDPTVEWKLRHRRNGLTGDEVRAAFQWPAKPLAARWEDHPVHGARLLATAMCERGMLKVALEPVDPVDGTWRLKTCLVT